MNAILEFRGASVGHQRTAQGFRHSSLILTTVTTTEHGTKYFHVKTVLMTFLNLPGVKMTHKIDTIQATFIMPYSSWWQCRKIADFEAQLDRILTLLAERWAGDTCQAKYTASPVCLLDFSWAFSDTSERAFFTLRMWRMFGCGLTANHMTRIRSSITSSTTKHSSRSVLRGQKIDWFFSGRALTPRTRRTFVTFRAALVKIKKNREQKSGPKRKVGSSVRNKMKPSIAHSWRSLYIRGSWQKLARGHGLPNVVIKTWLTCRIPCHFWPPLFQSFYTEYLNF